MTIVEDFREVMPGRIAARGKPEHAAGHVVDRRDFTLARDRHDPRPETEDELAEKAVAPLFGGRCHRRSGAASRRRLGGCPCLPFHDFHPARLERSKCCARPWLLVNTHSCMCTDTFSTATPRRITIVSK